MDKDIRNETTLEEMAKRIEALEKAVQTLRKETRLLLWLNGFTFLAMAVCIALLH